MNLSDMPVEWKRAAEIATELVMEQGGGMPLLTMVAAVVISANASGDHARAERLLQGLTRLVRKFPNYPAEPDAEAKELADKEPQ